jgi:hypothetical protein
VPSGERNGQQQTRPARPMVSPWNPRRTTGLSLSLPTGPADAWFRRRVIELLESSDVVVGQALLWPDG